MSTRSIHAESLSRFAVLVLVCYAAFACASDPWTFRSAGDLPGPNQWPTMDPACAGDNQSPIVLKRTTAAHIPSFKGYLLDKYLVLRNVNLTNNGHTAGFTMPSRKYTLRGGGLPTVYYAAEIHLHWGANSKHGSEHFIKHHNYAAEMHIINYKSSYKNVQEAKASKDDPTALAVIGILFEANYRSNADFAPISKGVSALQDVTPTEDFLPSTRLYTLHLGSLIRNAVRSGFFRYNGSLTYPPCTENVLWTIFKHPLSVSEGQIKPFRRLVSINGDYLEQNLRPPQPIGTRKLYFSPAPHG